MKYSPDLVDRIVKALEEVPNIRHVFNKLGINRSTFYRWYTIHHEFRERVTFALYKGRGNITDLAEGNIVRKIKEGDVQTSRFWLSHNEPRYMTEEKHMHYSRLIQHESKLSEKDAFKEDDKFQTFFESYVVLKNIRGEVYAKEFMNLILRKVTDGNEQLIDIFYATCEAWEKETEANLELDHELEKRLKKSKEE